MDIAWSHGVFHTRVHNRRHRSRRTSIYLSCTNQWLFIRFRLRQSHGILVPPTHPRLYMASFSLWVHAATSVGVVFFSAPGHDNMHACSGLYSLASPGIWDGPIIVYVVCMPAFVCVWCVCGVCAFEHASTRNVSFCQQKSPHAAAYTLQFLSYLNLSLPHCCKRLVHDHERRHID